MQYHFFALINITLKNFTISQCYNCHFLILNPYLCTPERIPMVCGGGFQGRNFNDLNT